MNNDQRWRQRLQNLNKAYQRLQAACAQTAYNELELAGLIQTYEFTFELSRKTLKDKLQYDGYTVNSPREAIKTAFAAHLIEDVDTWLACLETRNLFTHTYEETIATQAANLIKKQFAPLLGRCVRRLNQLAERE